MFCICKEFFEYKCFYYLVVIFEENFPLKMSQIFKEKSGLRVFGYITGPGPKGTAVLALFSINFFLILATIIKI